MCKHTSHAGQCSLAPEYSFSWAETSFGKVLDLRAHLPELAPYSPYMGTLVGLSLARGTISGTLSRSIADLAADLRAALTAASAPEALRLSTAWRINLEKRKRVLVPCAGVTQRISGVSNRAKLGLERVALNGNTCSLFFLGLLVAPPSALRKKPSRLD